MNENIRAVAKKSGVRLWQIAAHLGVSEPTITRWMRFPLSAEKESKILTAINELSRGCADA